MSKATELLKKARVETIAMENRAIFDDLVGACKNLGNVNYREEVHYVHPRTRWCITCGIRHPG